MQADDCSLRQPININFSLLIVGIRVNITVPKKKEGQKYGINFKKKWFLHDYGINRL